MDTGSESLPLFSPDIIPDQKWRQAARWASEAGPGWMSTITLGILLVVLLEGQCESTSRDFFTPLLYGLFRAIVAGSRQTSLLQTQGSSPR